MFDGKVIRELEVVNKFLAPYTKWIQPFLESIAGHKIFNGSSYPWNAEPQANRLKWHVSGVIFPGMRV